MASTLSKKELDARTAFEKTDASLKAALEAVETAAYDLYQRAGCYTDPITVGALQTGVEALKAQAERIESRRERNAADLARLIAAERTDKARFDRALAALRKEGFVATVSEPRYSSKTSSVEKAESEDRPRVWTYKGNTKDLFDSAGNFAKDTWAGEYDEFWSWETCEDPETGEKYREEHRDRVAGPFEGRAMAKGVYLYHGPDKATAERAVEVLRAHGLGVSWDGSTAQSIFVSTQERADRKANVERIAAEREAAKEAMAK